MTQPKERVLEQAYVLIARLAELRMDLDPHQVRGGMDVKALGNLLDALKPFTEDDMQRLAADMRDLAAAASGIQPDADARGEIIDLTNLTGELDDTEVVKTALLRALQTRCEELTGEKFLGTLWGTGRGGERMRAVLTIGGVRVPIMGALAAMEDMVKSLVEQRAEAMIRKRFQGGIDQVQGLLDHVLQLMKDKFGDPDADWKAAVAEAKASAPGPELAPGEHACIACDVVWKPAELKACPNCGKEAPVWYTVAGKEATDE